MAEKIHKSNRSANATLLFKKVGLVEAFLLIMMILSTHLIREISHVFATCVRAEHARACAAEPLRNPSHSAVNLTSMLCAASFTSTGLDYNLAGH